MDFHGIKKDGKKCLPPAIAEQARKHWESIKEGSPVVFGMTVPRKSKSQAQLGAVWGLMLTEACSQLSDRGYDTSFIYNTPEPTGIEITKEDLCKYLYNVCPMHNESGERITLSKSNAKEADEFFDKCRNWMASQWSVETSEPDPNWRNKDGTENKDIQ